MLRRVTPLLGVLALCCGQSVIADDFKSNIVDNGYTVFADDLNQFAKDYASCRNSPASGSLFGATICVVTPGVEDRFFVEKRPDLGVYDTNKVGDLLDQFKQEELERRYGKDGGKLKEEYCRSIGKTGTDCVDQLYNRETSTGVFRLNFRGLPIFASFPYKMGEQGKDGRMLVFSVPSLSINKIFHGSDREDSVEKLKDYLKKDGSTILSELAKKSPDPVTDSQKDIIRNDFSAGTGSKQGDGITVTEVVGTEVSTVYVGAGYDKREYYKDKEGRKFDKSITVRYLSLPLSMSIPLGQEQELILRLPLQYRETNGEAKSYQIAGGISYKTPVAYFNKPNNKNRWFLTPSFSYGMVGSKDQASVAQLVSMSLTSDLLLVERPNYSISMGNLIGYQQTLPFEYKGWKLAVERTNVITRNSILLSLPLSSLTSSKIFGIDLVAELFVIDTRAFGDEMYEDSYDEIGFTIGPRADTVSTKKAGEEGFVNVSRQRFGLGFRYHYSEVSRGGFGFSIGYQF